MNLPYNASPVSYKVLPGSHIISFESYDLLRTPDNIYITVLADTIYSHLETYLLNEAYVDPLHGNDSNTGVYMSPVRTITKAGKNVAPNGTIKILNADYYDNPNSTLYWGIIEEDVTLHKQLTVCYKGNVYDLIRIAGTHNFNGNSPLQIGVDFD